MVRDVFRSKMPVAPAHAYFDHAAVAPLPAATANRLKWFADQASQSGDKHWMDWSLILKRLRAAAAELLGASDSEVALVPNTTIGINLVVRRVSLEIRRQRSFYRTMSFRRTCSRGKI